MYSPPSLNNCDYSAVFSHLSLPHSFSFFGVFIKANLRKYNFTKKHFSVNLLLCSVKLTIIL